VAMAALYPILRAANPTLPLYVHARTEWNTDVADLHYSPDYVEWTAPDQLPTASWLHQENGDRRGVTGARQIGMIEVSPLLPFPVRDTLLRQLFFSRRDRDKPNAPAALGIDLHTIPVDRALTLLDECITPMDGGQR